jgi:hypothetical protein
MPREGGDKHQGELVPALGRAHLVGAAGPLNGAAHAIGAQA